MRIGSTKAEGVDAGQAGVCPGGPCLELCRYTQRQFAERDVGIRFFEMQIRRYLLMLEAQRCLDQSRNAGAGFQVSDVTFNRTNDTGAPLLPTMAQGRRQCAD